MSLLRTWARRRGDTSKKRREGKELFGFCAICVKTMPADALSFHMAALHGIIVRKEERYDWANGTGG